MNGLRAACRVIVGISRFSFLARGCGCVPESPLNAKKLGRLEKNFQMEIPIT